MPNDTPKKEYGVKEMVNDFLNPATYKKASDLCDEGNLTVKSINLTDSEDYGKSYAVTFDTDDGQTYLSYISAKQPFAVCEYYEQKLVGSVVTFDKAMTKDKKTILKMRLVVAGANLKD